jgi:hypothetical protein
MIKLTDAVEITVYVLGGPFAEQVIHIRGNLPVVTVSIGTSSQITKSFRPFK